MEVEGDSEGSREVKKTVKEPGERRTEEDKHKKGKDKKGNDAKDFGCRRRLRF